MSDNSAILEYLLENSELAKTLNADEPVTLEVLLAKYTDFEVAIAILQKLMQLATDKLKLSNCLLRNQYPYDAIADCSEDDLCALKELAEYLYLPKTLTERLETVQKCGKKCGHYKVPYTCNLYGIGSIHQFDIKSIHNWAYIGDIDGIKWLLDQGYELGSYNIKSAIAGKQLECAKFLYEMGDRKLKHTFSIAAYNGDIESLEWLYENGCEWDGHECSGAARRGNFECLKWLHEHGCPWGTNSDFGGNPFAEAIHNGHIECLKYLFENGAPLPGDVRETYPKNSKIIECYEYAHEHGIPLRVY